MAEIIIQQLLETTTQHQNAINTIQATLEAQQKDIVDIKTAIADIRISINHIIHSLSEITTKLDLQISLPPPLPLSPIPPSMLYATAVSSMTAAPSLSNPPAPPHISSAAAPFHHQPSLSTMAPSSPIKQYDSTHQILKSFSDFHIEFLVGIPDTLHAIYRKQQLEVALNSFDKSQLVGAQIPIGYGVVFMQKYRKDETSPNIKMLCENKIFIFDPGGIFDVDCILDLEDKVDFEGMVMMWFNNAAGYSYNSEVVMTPETLQPMHQTLLLTESLNSKLLSSMKST